METTGTETVEVTVTSPLGLHGRPAAHIVKLASAYHSVVTVKNLASGEVGDCRSILSLLVLAASQGTRLLLSAVGDDAAAALAEIAAYFAAGFNE
ncbi:MAG: HPr family phosphocarrier protein [Lentisphaeria bacterium]|nr:HPr family phosphocarrier protein [Lentisphaeria bacterium]